MAKPEINANQTRLLFVDDEPAIVNMLSVLLSDGDYQIAIALSGEEALEYLQENTVDVLVTDVYMDGMNGFELMKAACELDRHLQVIIITGHDCYDMISQALRHGAYDYLSKPLDDHEIILNSIHRAGSAARLERDNTGLLEQLSASHAMLANANNRLRELNDDLMVQATTDGLTGLYNRRHLDNALEQEVNRRNRYPDPLSVVMLDIDRFKSFNDHYGHEGGDAALQLLSSVLSASSRNIDVIGRFGGEEFMIILPKCTPENSIKFAERLRRAIETTPVKIGDNMARLTASIGITGVEKDDRGVTAQQLMSAADKALYVAKADGRNRVRQCLEFDSVDSNDSEANDRLTGT